MHTLLTAAGIKGRYIVMGHSMGGVISGSMPTPIADVSPG